MATPTKNETSRADGPARSGVRVPVGDLRTRQHRGGLIALLAVLVVVFALAGAWLYTSAGSKVTVVVVASDIDAGQAITRSDLTTTDMSGDVAAVPATDLEQLVGQRARVPLLAGTVLQSSMVGHGADIPDGHVLAGVALQPGATPASGVSVGDRVDVYRLPGGPAATDSDSAADVLAQDVVVHQVVVRESAGVSGLLVTLVLPQEAAAETVAAAGAGLVSLTVVGP